MVAVAADVESALECANWSWAPGASIAAQHPVTPCGRGTAGLIVDEICAPTAVGAATALSTADLTDCRIRGFGARGPQVETKPCVVARSGLSGGCDRLTSREQEILLQVAMAKTSREIASGFGIVQPTVHNHLRHIYEKFEVSSRTAAVAKFLQDSGEPDSQD